MRLDDLDRQMFSDLAEKLMCAYLAHQTGMAFTTIQRRYGSKATKEPIGDYWIMLAIRTSQEMTEIQDAVDKKKKTGKPSPTGPRVRT